LHDNDINWRGSPVHNCVTRYDRSHLDCDKCKIMRAEFSIIAKMKLQKETEPDA